MGESKNSKKTVWVYAVILFTSAFIVLLISAYSQIKFNRNIDDYKNKISSREIENSNFKLNLNSAIEENDKLKNEIENLKKEINSIKKGKDTLEKSKDEIEKSYKEKLSSYENLVKAEKLFIEGNIVESAKILKSEKKSELLNQDLQTLYKNLVKMTYEKASKQLYVEGYNQYKNKSYQDSIISMKLSYDFSDKEYYSDDCLYYIAHAEYNLGNNDGAEQYIKEILNKYPDSTLRKESEDLLKIINR